MFKQIVLYFAVMFTLCLGITIVRGGNQATSDRVTPTTTIQKPPTPCAEKDYQLRAVVADNDRLERENEELRVQVLVLSKSATAEVPCTVKGKPVKTTSE